MIPKLIWALAVGIPIYYLFYLGMAGLGYNYGTISDYIPHQDFVFLFLTFGSIGIAIAVWRYSGRLKMHGTSHCEWTSASELGLIATAIVITAMTITKGEPPIGRIEDWVWLLGLALLASTIAIFLYRIEKGKPVIPRLR